MSNCTMGLFFLQMQWRGEVVNCILRHVAMVAKFLDDNKSKRHCFKLHRSYLISFNLSNVGEIFWVKSDRTVSKFRKRKRKFLCRAHPVDKAGEWNWEVPWRSRATTAKKCTKNCDAQAKLFFCQSKSVNQKIFYHSNVTSHFSTLYCSFGVDVKAAMLLIRNKSITLLWEVKPAI